MAISLVAYGSTFSANSSSTSITLNKPAGATTGDLLVAVVATDQFGTITPPSGWSLKKDCSVNSGSDDVGMWVLMRDCDAADPASWTATLGTAAVKRLAVVGGYRGADVAANQFHAFANQADGTDSVTINTPYVTPSVSTAWRISACAVHDNATSAGTFTADKDTERADFGIGSADPTLSLAVYDSNATVATTAANIVYTFAPGSGTLKDTSSCFIGLLQEPVTIPTAQTAVYGVLVDWDNNNSFSNYTIDTFSRADSVSLGNTETGNRSWAVKFGTPSILSNQIGPTTSGNTMALFDSGVSDIALSVTLAAGLGVTTNLLFRMENSADPTGWLFQRLSSGSYYLSKYDGTSHAVAIGGTSRDGDVLKVRCSGNSIQCYVNKELLFSTTDSFQSTSTFVGWQTSGGTSPRLDNFIVAPVDEDLTDRTLRMGGPVEFEYGRDQARALNGMQPGETSFEINNRSRDYSPENTGSPLYGNLLPGRPARITAQHGANSYNVFQGYLDGYEIMPEIDRRSVKFTALDMFAKLGSANVSTAMYPVTTTGLAIDKILDEIGWSSSLRDIDDGATVVRWWWENNTNALEAIAKLVDAEGPPAFAYVDPNTGNFIFRSRHHRLTQARSVNLQATFSDTGTEPLHSPPFEYDIGWRDLVNSVDVVIDEREPTSLTTVWSTTDYYSIAAGETRVIRVEAQDPFISSLTPVSGTDYTLVSGAVTVSLLNVKGQMADISILATSAAVINGMALRAIPVPVARTVQVQVQDDVSIAKHGIRSYPEDIPWAGVNDAAAIGDAVVTLRADRLPVVHITVKNANGTRLHHSLARQLSDRIRIVEAETFTSHDFYIEQIAHSIQEVGKVHSVTFGCERASSQTQPVFTFDVDGAGFDDGFFGIGETDDSTTVFVLGTSKLNQGKLGT